MRKISLYLFILLSVSSCKVQKYERLTDGIIVHVKEKTENEVQAVRIQVITDKVFHVTASPANGFSKMKSLVVADRMISSVKWDVKELNDTLVLSTSQAKAFVALHTGEISFTDSIGNPLLCENKGGGKTFIPVVVGALKTYRIRQVFESPSDEAFYGLGQHQYDIMNYKGKDIDLYQYNTKVSVPFVVSSKNYGILWDNYSRSKFGDIRDYEQISKLKLYDSEGNPGGLSATYYASTDTSKVFVVRKEPEINYDVLDAMSKFPKDFKLDKGSVKWTGAIEADSSCEYKFSFYSAGFSKVWFDGKLVSDRWRQCWNATHTYFNFNLQKGKKYPITIEWIPDGAESYISLKYLPQLPDAEQGKLSLYSEVGDQINYYFIKGNNLDDVISGYRQISGKSPIMPKWAMGFWQSRERYKTQEELLSVAKEFRKRQVPIDNIVLDWQYWKIDQWGSQEFDTSRFPDAEGMIKELHNLNTRIMISVWPKFYEGTENYKKMDAKGFLYKRNIENHQKDWLGYVSTFYDPFNAQAREFFWSLVNKSLYSKGIDAWWLDASEPDIHSNLSIEQRKMLMNPTALGPASQYFNAFPLVNEKGMFEGQRSTNPDQRVFILTRSAFAGSQRFAAATWSGDVGSRWEELRRQVPAGLNFSLAGIPYWTTDIGGFAVEKRYEKPSEKDLDEWRELNTRWFQFGTFCPLFRVHGQFPFREIFNIAPENHPAYQGMLYYDKLRYRLMPYIYTLAGKTYHEDYTIMRALSMDFGKDAKVLNIGDQFMFGPSLLISPVYEYKARNRNVYLPATSGWYDLYSGKYTTGGQNINVEAPYHRIPVFVKEGAIIPFGPEIQYAMEKSDPITLYVYAGTNGSFTLYEDEGITYQYEKGAYSSIPITYNENSKTLTIGERKGTFKGMAGSRTFRIVYVTKDKPLGFDFNQKNYQTIQYNGTDQSVKME